MRPRSSGDEATVPRKLVVTADDFGLTRATSAAIIEAHRNGIVTAVSVLGNGPTGGTGGTTSVKRFWTPRLGLRSASPASTSSARATLRCMRLDRGRPDEERKPDR